MEDIPTFDMIMASLESGQDEEGEESLDTSLIWDDTKEDEFLIRLCKGFEM